MAVAIDTKALSQELIPRLQRYLDQETEHRFQIYRLCAHATVIHFDDAGSYRRLLETRELRLAEQEALDCRLADQGEVLEEGKVFRHLESQAATSPMLLKTLDRSTTATTTLVASALSPSFATRTQGRAVSSFLHHSLRCACLKNSRVLSRGFAYSSAIPAVFPSAGKHYAWVYFPEPDLNIFWSGGTGHKPVVWNMQLDVVALSTSITIVHYPGKRRRTAVNQFLGVSEGLHTGDDLACGRSEKKKFNGVRHRDDRRKWVAEMTPYRGKGKVHFGVFPSEVQAASAVDAAYHHFDMPEMLNFPDRTPQILSSRPRPSDLAEHNKLAFVKKEAKWLGCVGASTPLLPSAPAASLTSESQAWNSNEFELWFRSLSEIPPCVGGGDVDELADNGSYISSLEAPITRKTPFPSSVHITEGWDFAPDLLSSGAVTTNAVTNHAPQPVDSQRMCSPFLVMSPPGPAAPTLIPMKTFY